MTTSKKVQKPRASRKGKRRPSVKERAREIISGFTSAGYSDDTRHAIKAALDENASDLAELVRRAEAGEDILDVRGPVVARRRAEEMLETRRYGEAINAKLRAALDKPDELKRLLEALDAGEKKFHSLFAKSYDDGAVDYAFKAYSAALDHYHANQGDPFALSRLGVVYGETQPGDVHIVVTLPGHLRDSWVKDEDVRGWIKDAELFARTLAHPKCDEAFRRAFGAIYTDEMLQGSGVDWMTPEVLRVMFPLLMLSGSGTNHVCDDAKARDILILLHSELVNEETDGEVRASLGMQ